MTSEVLFGGVFGLLAALIGAGGAYLLGISRDQRIKKEEQKIIYSALIVDLKATLRGFELNEDYLPRFTARDIFVMKGGHIFSPASISIALEDISHMLVRITDITKENHEYNVAVASVGESNLVYNNHNYLQERSDLIQKVKNSIPELIEGLGKFA